VESEPKFVAANPRRKELTVSVYTGNSQIASGSATSGRARLKDIALHCGRAEGHDNNWKCNCPVCGRHSLSVTPKLRTLIFCHHCKACGINDGHNEQRVRLVEAGLIDPDERPPKWDKEAAERYDAKERAKARAQWESPFVNAITPDRTAGKYLRARGLETFIGQPALRTNGSELISRVWHVQHGLSAVQYTLLLMDGSDRDRSVKRRTIGPRSGGAVWIEAPCPDEEFVVAEGLETCLSAMLILKCRCGAAVLGPNLAGLILPPTARKIHIAADNDETGIPAAQHAQDVWVGRGLCVRISHPATEGWDFNNELLGR
jgi:hypothetical protein